MKALSLTQPWASLVALGAKRIETRSWATNYRGPLAIHAAKNFPKWAREFALEPVCYEAVHARYSLRDIELKASGFPAYPLGVVVATVNLVNVLPTELLRGGTVFDVSFERISEQEKVFGDYSDGRFGWLLDNVVQLPRPIPVKGALGLWECTLL